MARVELCLAGGLMLGAIFLAQRGAHTRRALGAALCVLGLLGIGLAWPSASRLALAHGHNVIALLLWAALYARTRRSTALVVCVVLGLAALLLVSPLAWLGFQHGIQSAFGLHSFTAADTLAPGVRSAPRAVGVVACFAFLQAVHYAVWLHAIPQETTPREATLSFRMSLRSLRLDLGRLGLLAVTAAAALMLLAGLRAPLATKAWYPSISSFHAYLELAAAALFFVRASGPTADVASMSNACP